MRASRILEILQAFPVFCSRLSTFLAIRKDGGRTRNPIIDQSEEKVRHARETGESAVVSTIIGATAAALAYHDMRATRRLNIMRAIALELVENKEAQDNLWAGYVMSCRRRAAYGEHGGHRGDRCSPPTSCGARRVALMTGSKRQPLGYPRKRDAKRVGCGGSSSSTFRRFWRRADWAVDVLRSRDAQMQRAPRPKFDRALLSVMEPFSLPDQSHWQEASLAPVIHHIPVGTSSLCYYLSSNSNCTACLQHRLVVFVPAAAAQCKKKKELRNHNPEELNFMLPPQIKNIPQRWAYRGVWGRAKRHAYPLASTPPFVRRGLGLGGTPINGFNFLCA
ncbi:hypothetical protein DFH08DRAFT_799098 [Mycena albidolilacea]|uniref:Uncharacterized protein n=1 Tax=Mycena albidolilacea TaxID=1033008 RepID=A0AAD7AQZ4_9AGAR|nr:hypothetical protein DFH08DRAFT_799098 [Mycena albidolilacea]